MSSWLKRLLIEFIAKCIPKRGKRIIYIVLCYIIWSNNTDEHSIRRELIEINNKLKLTDDERSLQFVIELRNVLLDCREFKYLRDIQPDAIPEKTPACLRYGTIQKMRDDLSYVFKERYCRECVST